MRDSKEDWNPYIPKKAPEGSPNVLIVLYDDTGLAAWSPYRGRINMPTLDRLAANGLTYTQWHNTALCSPTRSTFLTGRNHHLNGMACITEAALGYPGASGRIPAQSATIANILHDNGWSTYWIGKNHNVPEPDVASGANRSSWPLQQGFDRFYGFLGGETNQWYPDLVEDNQFIEAPSEELRPETAWGLYQMHGNVWEWCAGGLRKYDSGPQVDPRGPERNEAGASRAGRGGSSDFLPRGLRAAFRGDGRRGVRSADLGFRFSLRSTSQQWGAERPPEAAVAPEGPQGKSPAPGGGRGEGVSKGSPARRDAGPATKSAPTKASRKKKR